MKYCNTPQRFSFLLYCLLSFFSFNALAQVGIGNTDPKTTLDVSGALSLREGPALSVGNGMNINLGTPIYSQYRITDPTADFDIKTFLTPNGESSADGQLLTLINSTPYTMTLVHDQGSNANPQRRIYCPGESNLILNGKYASVTLRYNTELLRWIVINYADTEYGNNIISVRPLTDASTNSSSFSIMDGMTVTFIPKHSTVFVSFSASGEMAAPINYFPEQCFANFRLVNVTAGNKVEAGVTTLVTDYDYDNTIGEAVATSWNASLGMLPVTVTPGVSTTLKIEWLRDGNYARTLLCNANSDPNQSHRNLTVFD